jgi:hypothetical protein
MPVYSQLRPHEVLAEGMRTEFDDGPLLIGAELVDCKCFVAASDKLSSPPISTLDHATALS